MIRTEVNVTGWALSEMVSCGTMCSMCKLCEQVAHIHCVTSSWTMRVDDC